MSNVMVVIAKLHDFIVWLTPAVARFPRTLKAPLADRLLAELLEVMRILVQARYTRERRGLLDRANLALEYVRHLLRLAKDLRALSLGQYEHAARSLDEVGRMVGGWRRSGSPPIASESERSIASATPPVGEPPAPEPP